MPEVSGALLELIRLTATSLPPDVEAALQDAAGQEEPGSAAHATLETILKNVGLAREFSTPICQDTGTPAFYVRHPSGWFPKSLRAQINTALDEATRLSYLRPNAVNALTGVNSGGNTGDEYFPAIHFEEGEDDALVVDLVLKGGGCENVGAQYKLPDAGLNAGRDLEGVRKVVLDAVCQAQGRGCAPGVLGVAIGGDRGSGYLASKQVFLRKLGDTHPDSRLAELEARITREANTLGIGPMGFGGKTTVLATKIRALYRLPASFFVTVSYMCWAFRRRRMVLRGDLIWYE